MLRRETWRLKRFLWAHAEIHIVEDDLHRGLILHIAPRYRDSHHRMIIMEKQRGAQRDPRPLAGLDDVGSSRERVQAAKPASMNNARMPCHTSGARQAAWSRCDD